MVISSYLILSDEDRPLVLSQSVILRCNGVVVYNNSHKSMILTRRVDGKSVRHLDNDIVEIGVISGAKESLFVINGYGGCSWCTEYTEIFNGIGQSILLSYHDKSKIYSENGDWLSIRKKYGIDVGVYEKGKYQKKRVALGM
jgi:hypothetical protein